MQGRRLFFFKRGGTKSVSESSIDIGPQVAPERRERPVIGDVITEVQVVASCKLKGYLRVQEGDRVDLLGATHPEPGIVYARFGGETGRIIRSAVKIDAHTSNLYLNAVKIAVFEAPQLLWNAIENQIVSAADVHDMLVASGFLFEGISALVGMEAREKERRHLSAEFMRDASPAMALASQIMGSAAATKWRESLLRTLVSRIRAVTEWTPIALLDLVETAFEFLQREALNLTTEMALLLKAVGETSSIQMAGSFFCLRFLCPCLVQPQACGGLHESDLGGDITKALMSLAKTLQLIANGVDPSEGSFSYPIRKELLFFQESMTRVCNRMIGAIEKTGMKSIERILLEPAATFFKYACQESQTKAILDLKERLGETKDIHKVPTAILEAETMLKSYG